MTFVYPAFLWALAAILIPVIIHLFNFRTHKTVYFSNVAFLEDIEQETKSRNRIKDLLVLLMRILAIVALVLAFAKPLILDNKTVYTKECDNSYAIYLDNSFSMTALNAEGANIDFAKSKATDILSAFKQNSQYLFITNEITPEQQHFYIKDLTQNFISQTNVCPVYRDMSFVLNKFSELFKTFLPDCNKTLFIISDFQKKSFDIQNFVYDSTINVVLLPVKPHETSNLYIDSAWFQSPFHLYNSNDSLVVKIVNKSELDFNNQQIKLFINDTLKTLSTYSVEANSEVEVKLIFSNTVKGNIRGKIEIDDYPVTYDNELYFNYYIAPQIKVLLIEGQNQKYLKRFYDDINYFEVTSVASSNIPVSEIYNYDAVILASVEQFSSGLINELYNYTENGGVVVVIPSVKANIGSLNDLLNRFQLPVVSGVDTTNLSVSGINLSDKIYKDVFEEIKPNSEMPEVYNHFIFAKTAHTFVNELLTLENDDYFLINKEVVDGNIYVFSSEMIESQSNFMTNPVSVPTFYNIPVFTKLNSDIYQIIGNNKSFKINNIESFESIRLRNFLSGYEFYPQIMTLSKNTVSVNIGNSLPESGNYQIINQDEEIGVLSLNYSRLESDLQYYSVQEIDDLLKKYNLKSWTITDNHGTVLQNELQTDIKGKNLWKLFIVLALLFILGEILIIRIIKN